MAASRGLEVLKVARKKQKQSDFSVTLFIPICNVLVPHQSVEHGHDVHGHGATISSAHEHSREEEGEGIYWYILYPDVREMGGRNSYL